MRFATERVEERPGNRAAGIELGRAAAQPSLGAGRYQPKFRLARLMGRGAGGLVRRIGRMFSDLWYRRRRAAAIRELRDWDDRMLKDIGLTRGEVTAAVDGQLDRGGQRRIAQTPGAGFGTPHDQQGGGGTSRPALDRERA